MFIIEDELHAEPHGEFATRDEALAELERRAAIPWNVEPNIAPCMSWETCGRCYELVEYDTSVTPWRELRRERVLEISAAGTKWLIRV